MPWHIEADNPGCEGFAVVKDGTTEVEGCHRTRAQAERQLAALYASEPEARAEYPDDVDEEGMGESEEEAVVATDIDDTIVRNGTQPIREVIDKINAIGLDVYVITGRDPARRAETERLLDDIGLKWDDLLMVGSQEAKRDAILAVAAEHPIAYAFENDETVRGYYREAGASNVSARSRRQEVEEMLAELRAVRYSSK